MNVTEISYLILIWIAVATGREEIPSIKTTSGTLKGKTLQLLGKHLNVFLGVPYAYPPLGNLRFKAPVPYINDDSVLSAEKFAPICYQPPHVKSVLHPLLLLNSGNMSEDCLYLNIYVPQNNQEDEFPVIIWLTGEGFSYADPTQFDGSFLATTQNLIVITVSYRVSIFGFFNGLSEEAPGNVGLWDQRLALKWVKQNIRAFGGNPDKITLSGRFSGAMSAVIQAFSPLSRHESLFKRIILHSGVPNGKWVFNSNPISAAMDLAEVMDCVFSNFSVTILCLKLVPAEVLLKHANSMQDSWRPSLDFSLITESSLPELLKEKYSKVDVLIGTNKDEGSLCLTALSVFNPTLYQLIKDDKLSEADSKQLITSFMFSVYKESKPVVDDLVSFTYAVRNKSHLGRKFVEFCGDLYINALSGKLADLISEKEKNVFVYELSHRPSFSIQPSFIEAGHGDDVLYSFGLPLKLDNLPQQEMQLTRRIMETISNFVYYGNPNARGEKLWQPYNKDSKLVRRFDNHPETPEISKSRHVNAVHFWQDIIPAIFDHACPPAPMTAALTENKNDSIHHAHFLGTWLSIPVAEYIIVGLLCASTILLISVGIALVIILRHTSTRAFQRLK